MSEPDVTTETAATTSAAGAGPVTSRYSRVAAAELRSLVPFLQAALLAFLGVMGVGAVFVIALKLQYPDLGAGSDPVEVLISVVILGLASLRVPVHIGDLTLTVLPLGALVCVAWIVRWSCLSTVSVGRPRRGLLVGAFFGPIAAAAALVFRFRFESDPIFAGALGAFLWGLVWVSLFAGVVFASSGTPLHRVMILRLVSIKERRPSLYEGVRTAALMLGLDSLLAITAGLLWTIFWLLSGGGPRQLSLADLVAVALYVLAFTPNLVIAVLSLSLGAPVDVGAAVTIGARVRGPLRHLSVFDGPAVLLLAVPLIACVAGGYWVRKNANDPSKAVRVLGSAAVIFAVVLGAFALLGQARLGGQLVTGRGFALVAPRAWMVLLLGFGWAAAGGYAGWLIAERRR